MTKKTQDTATLTDQDWQWFFSIPEDWRASVYEHFCEQVGDHEKPSKPTTQL